MNIIVGALVAAATSAVAACVKGRFGSHLGLRSLCAGSEAR
jgi:hypothetical protein